VISRTISRARGKSSGRTQLHAMTRLIWDPAGDAVFPERARQILRHRLVFAGPRFGGRFVRIPIVRQRLLRSRTAVIELGRIAGSRRNIFLALNPLQRIIRPRQIASMTRISKPGTASR